MFPIVNVFESKITPTALYKRAHGMYILLQKFYKIMFVKITTVEMPKSRMESIIEQLKKRSRRHIVQTNLKTKE